MNKYIFSALLMAGVSAYAVAGPAHHAKLTLALYDGGQAELLQPVALNKQTNKVAKRRVNVATDELNAKINKQLEEKLARELINASMNMR